MDPLRPFASLIRSLWLATKSRSAGGTRTADSPGATSTSLPGVVAAAAPQAITSRLHARLSAQGEWNPAHARELFVECILLNELGEDLARDPGFTELVRKVSFQMGNEPAISARLDQLLRDLTSARQMT